MTVAGVELVGGVAVSFTGVWRARYGLASECVGDVVVQLVAPVTRLDCAARPGAAVVVRACVSVAGRRCWWTVADVREAGRDWPYVVAPLAVVAGAPLAG